MEKLYGGIVPLLFRGENIPPILGGYFGAPLKVLKFAYSHYGAVQHNRLLLPKTETSRQNPTFEDW